MQSWQRRKQFEARLLAIEVGRLFGGGGATSGQPSAPAGGRTLPAGSQRVSPDQMLNFMGITL